MNSDKKIFLAFILNLFFSIIEFIGGIFTNSISIISDSIHDFCDSISIGISYFLEKFSKKKANYKYTYGYLRYSVLGAFVTSMMLLVGSIIMISTSINRILNPQLIRHDEMILIAIFGVIINFFATYFTKNGKSLNQKSVNLHMLDDVLGWIIVLIGSILIKITNIIIIDSIISIVVSLFILLHVIEHLKMVLDIFLEKTPCNVSIEKIKEEILKIESVKEIYHIHVWSLDGINNFATLHIVTDISDLGNLKKQVREKFLNNNVGHVTIEIDNDEKHDDECNLK